MTSRFSFWPLSRRRHGSAPRSRARVYAPQGRLLTSAAGRRRRFVGESAGDALAREDQMFARQLGLPTGGDAGFAARLGVHVRPTFRSAGASSRFGGRQASAGSVREPVPLLELGVHDAGTELHGYLGDAG